MKAGWKATSFSDVCSIDSALVDPRKAEYSDLLHVGGANIESSNGVLIDLKTAKDEGLKSGKFLFDDSTVLYSKIRPYLMKVARPAFRGLCSADIYPLTPKPGVLERDYLYHVLLSPEFTDFAVAGSARAGMPKVNRDHLFSYSFLLPPLSEQQRIVGILDEAFEGIATAKANAEKNLQNARALFESHLQSVFTQRGDGWVVKSVAELVAEGALVKPFDGNHGEIHPRKADYTQSGVPFIMACDLKNGTVDTQQCTFISRKLADSLRVGFAKDGDVLISHKGTIGRSAIVSTADEYIMLTPQVTSYRVKDASQLFNRFIRYYFMSPVFQREMIAGAADGSTRAYIGITKQLTLRFRFPPLAEQKRIAAELDILDPETQRLATIYERKLAALDDLKKSLLHQAFSGEL